MLLKIIRFKAGIEYYNFGYGLFWGIIVSFCFYSIIFVSAIFHFIGDDTFRYLFSTMPQVLGAIIALSATFFIIIYDNTRKEKDNYHNRLIRALSAVEHRPYGDIYKEYIKKDITITKALDGKIKVMEKKWRDQISIESHIRLHYLSVIKNSLKSTLSFMMPNLYSDIYLDSFVTRYPQLNRKPAGISDQDPVEYNFSREEYLIEVYKDEIKWNENEYISYFNRLENLKNIIRFVYVVNLLIIGLLIIILTLTDWGFNEKIVNIQGAIMLAIGLLSFIVGLILIGKSILDTIKEE